TAASSPPCSLQVTPTQLDFDTVVPGTQSLLGAKVFNAGADVCVLQQLTLTDTGGNVFSLPAGSITGLTMAPGDYFTFEVQFTAPVPPGVFHGEAQVVGTSQAPIPIPITATTGSSCLSANPGFVDFGIVSPACPASTSQINVENGCATPVTVN